MELSEIIRRAEKELQTATRNLETANRRGAPEQDVRNLEAKVEYRHFVVWILQEMNGGRMDYKELVWKLRNDALWENTCEQAATAIAELSVKVEQLQKENADLLKRAEQAERERDAAIKTIFKYSKCYECKHWNSDEEWCEKHDRYTDGTYGCSVPEWIGMKEE